MHRYLKSNKANEYRMMLANHFEKQSISPRKVDELPWLYFKAENWYSLQSCLLDLDLFSAWYTENTKWDIIHYWTKVLDYIESNPSFEPAVQMYQSKLDEIEQADRPQEEKARIFYSVAELFREMAVNEPAEDLYHKTIAIQEETLKSVTDKAKKKELSFHLADTLDSLALLYRKLGKYSLGQEQSERSIEVLKASHGPRDISLVTKYCTLGAVKKKNQIS